MATIFDTTAQEAIHDRIWNEVKPYSIFIAAAVFAIILIKVAK